MTGGLRLHHVGFVVADIASAMPGFVRSLAGEWDGRIIHDPLQKVHVAFLSTGPGGQIELVAPAGEASPVTRLLESRGGGLHHVCYETGAIADWVAAMKGNGARIVSRPKPAVAFEGRQIAWVLTAENLLVELLEA